MENTCSIYLSNNRFLISLLFPTQRTKLQSLSLVISRSFPIPIPEYAAASSKVKFAFSQIGISYMQYLQFLYPSGKTARISIYKCSATSHNLPFHSPLSEPDPPILSLTLACDFISHGVFRQPNGSFGNSSFSCFSIDFCNGHFFGPHTETL